MEGEIYVKMLVSKDGKVRRAYKLNSSVKVFIQS